MANDSHLQAVKSAIRQIVEQFRNLREIKLKREWNLASLAHVKSFEFQTFERFWFWMIHSDFGLAQFDVDATDSMFILNERR